MSAPSPSTRTLGVHFSGETAYVALVDPTGAVVPIAPPKLEAAGSEPQPKKLRGFLEALTSEIRRHRVSVVAVARPLMLPATHDGAFTRFALEAALILAAEAENAEYVSVGQQAAAKACGIVHAKGNPIAQELAVDLGKRHVEIATEPHWKLRATALAVALAAASGSLPKPKPKTRRRKRKSGDE